MLTARLLLAFLGIGGVVVLPASVPPQFQCNRNCYPLNFEPSCNEISHPVFEEMCWRCCLNDP
ncbi:hypothetical protein FA13DRAFT_1729822 [Coprinellus micaceus]|uniref:CBM1 domain-containing protein n=1 Tax=Coprinellus micaceus TaxID=71717 RepID=A0A4Y7TLC1_COPMI|nr:hypothetical protein FA13DRAFT_1729822 [Coprinellus micaceus]